MTPDDLLGRLAADLGVARALRQADRPDGLTASSLGHCQSYAARTLLDEPKGESSDTWRALRGHYLHSGLADDLALVDPGFVDGRKAGRFTWQPGAGLPVITGEYDFIFAPPVDTGSIEPPVLIEMKTRSRNECRWFAYHGPDPQQSMQASVAAEALGVPLAAVLFMPVEGGLEEASAHLVDVAHWTAEARAWLWQVDVRAEYQALRDRGVPADQARERVLDPVPRDKPFTWCELLCERFKTCRGSYLPPPDLEIPDPTIRAAAKAAVFHRERRLWHEKQEAAAKSMLRAVEGTVHDGPVIGEPDGEVRVTQQHVKPKDGRRGHTRTKVERRQA